MRRKGDVDGVGREEGEKEARLGVCAKVCIPLFCGSVCISHALSVPHAPWHVMAMYQFRGTDPHADLLKRGAHARSQKEDRRTKTKPHGGLRTIPCSLLNLFLPAPHTHTRHRPRPPGPLGARPSAPP